MNSSPLSSESKPDTHSKSYYNLSFPIDVAMYGFVRIMLSRQWSHRRQTARNDGGLT